MVHRLGPSGLLQEQGEPVKDELIETLEKAIDDLTTASSIVSSPSMNANILRVKASELHFALFQAYDQVSRAIRSSAFSRDLRIDDEND